MRVVILFSAICGSLLASSSVQAAVTVAYDAGVTNTTTALTGTGTYGNMMDGMEVTAFFAAGGSETAIWADTGSTAGAASGTDWSLSESGDTWSGTWVLSATVGITRVLIDAGPGNTVFDTTFGGAFGTDGSASGKSFSVTSDHSNLNIYATYRDAVALGTAAPVGDLYRYLDIEFRDTAFQGSLGYQSDTDNIEFAGDIAPLPEPTTLAIWSALGGLGMIAARRRRKVA